MTQTFELDPPPGIFPDETGYAAKGRWADCSGIRWNNESGRPEAMAGGGIFHSTAIGKVRTILAYNAGYSSGANVTKIAYATASPPSSTGLYIGGVGVEPASIKPITGFSTSRLSISLATWGTTLLAAPSHDTLYEWSGSGLATAVTEAPDEIVRMLVSPERRQVLAFGCTDVSGSFNNRCIRCSDLEDYSSAGSWTPSSTNNSDEVILADTSSIVGAEWVGSYAAVWTETSLFIGQFIGDPNQTWHFDHVASGCGLLGQKCVVVINGAAYWMGRDGQFRTWTPGTIPIIVPCPVIRDFHANFNIELSAAGAQIKRDTCFMGAKPSKGEIYFYYNDDRDDLTSAFEPTRYMALNLRHNAWSRDSQTFTAMFDLNGFYQANGAPLTVVLVGQHLTGLVAQVENPVAGYGPWSLTSADHYLDSGRRRVMVTRWQPDFETQTGMVRLTLFCRNYPQGDVATKGTFDLPAGGDKKDFRASGKLISVKLQSDGSGATKLGRQSFDYVALGER